MILSRLFHADAIEVIQFVCSNVSSIYAYIVMREARRDRREYRGNGAMEILARSAVERTTAMLISQACLLVGGACSLFMVPPFGHWGLNDQAIVFRVFVIASTIAASVKSWREQRNRLALWHYQERNDKRSTDQPQAPEC